ncbi:hypothetical protein Q4566_15035 [Tamlana sp. 2_MG-2023]|uniref:hypothetical protein n=1 Tax=unclassified Tamlana TaxID=2614803 RepID=UPI0026E3B3AE|nr:MULTISPECIES: hypothetical protein [unclassified Tamlana]MDO6761525.1 hypothetical protein [Tamlana sp. 2_MG-2023]MDO6792381.1 hypothetical protein [Tamlana sp. 1_MG-2023]
MKNTLELVENNEVVATTTFEIIDVKSSVWLDSIDKVQKQEDGSTKTAFYGENLKIVVETEGIDDETELEIEVFAKNDEGATVDIKDDNEETIKITAKTASNKTTFEHFYVNPKWFDKEAPLTYFFNLKMKDENTIIKENLPAETEDQLKPIGFGKPDEFKIDKEKGYLLEKNENGKKIAYTSGERLDILKYQKWFEDDSEELDFSDKKQIDSYFNSVYLTYLFKWSIRGEFGNEKNRKRIIAAFEKAGNKYNIPPSVLYTYAVGEGMNATCSQGSSTNLDAKVDSFIAFGLDFFEKQVVTLRNKGYLDNTFNSAGTIVKETNGFTIPTPFNGKYAITRFPDGSTRTRSEDADNEKIINVYPVIFKNMDAAIEGACAIYANAFDYTAKSAQNIGWGKLTLNQQVFFGYIKIQKTSEQGNAEINRYRKKSNANFLDEDYTDSDNDLNLIKNKCYHRWVAWRYILLGKHFTK